MSKEQSATHRLRRPSVAGFLALAILAGPWWLAGCGGSDEPAPESTSSRQAAEAPAAQQADADAQAEARAREMRQRVDGAKREATQLKTEAERGGFAADEELGDLLAQLDRSVSQAESAVSSASGPDSQLQQVDGLQRQAASRLSTLKAAEEEERRELIERAEAMSAEAAALPIDQMMGLDGAVYLTYRRSLVEQVQGALNTPASGELDVDTQVAIGRFQQKNGMYISGIPSPKTRRALFGGDGEDPTN